MWRDYRERDAAYQKIMSLHSALIGYDKLRRAVAAAVFEAEMRDRFEEVKRRAKSAGYTKLTVGPCKHWKHTKAYSSMLFAEPKIRTGQGYPSVPLWGFVTDPLGGHSCGNGLDHADQCQLRIPSSCMTPFVGEHVL